MYRIGNEEIEAVRRVIESKQLFKVNSGELQETWNAEKELCEKFCSDYSLIMTSGHAALASALVALGIGPSDQVIVPGYTYIATAMAVLEAGAIPVIAEIDESLTIDPTDFEAKITPNTKAVIPVHIKGFPSDMARICEIAKKHNIAVVEDACQADGASFGGKRLGTIGDAGAYSFNFFKIISMGEGGALVTNRQDVFEAALIYHDASAIAFFGNQMEGFATEAFCGSEYRTNEIATAIFREQLKKLDSIIADLRRNKKYVMDRLQPYCRFIRSNDIEGDLGTTAALLFDTADEAERVGALIQSAPTIHTGKHVYSKWEPILKKRGAFHPLMDPFKMAANKDIIPDYTEDMCPVTLDLLSRTVYIEIDPDWTQEAMDAKIRTVIEALSQ
ncbi:MAG: aminotransferase class V-fold PLP-dependent enzyme [Clostridia bacterium]|nr:aminotransferase class V-fold PLP-dependent enzyme [Clostridia bacterium]